MGLDRIVPAAFRGALALATGLVLLAGCGKRPVTPTVPLQHYGYVTLTPASDSLTVGGTRLFVAAVFDTDSVAVSSPSVSWSSSNPAVASVSAAGLTTANGEGAALIIATSGDQSSAAIVRVYTQNGWYAQTSNTAQTLNGIFVQPDGRTGFAVGDVGAMVMTADAGATWTPVTSGTASHLSAVWFTSGSAGWAVGNAGTVLKTTDGGASWVRQLNVGTAQNLFGVRFADGNHGWVVGAGGVIARTIDGGATWTRTFPTVRQLNSVSFPDTLNGWAVGESGVIVGTHDGGASWYVVQPAVTAQSLRGVSRLGNALAWAVGAQGSTPSTAATADSLAWSISSQGASNQFMAVQFLDALTGYAVGSNAGGLIMKTTDGGGTWHPQVANAAQGLNGVYFVDALRGWAVGDAGRIVHTSRGGNL